MLQYLQREIKAILLLALPQYQHWKARGAIPPQRFAALPAASVPRARCPLVADSAPRRWASPPPLLAGQQPHADVSAARGRPAGHARRPTVRLPQCGSPRSVPPALLSPRRSCASTRSPLAHAREPTPGTGPAAGPRPASEPPPRLSAPWLPGSLAPWLPSLRSNAWVKFSGEMGVDPEAQTVLAREKMALQPAAVAADGLGEAEAEADSKANEL